MGCGFRTMGRRPPLWQESREPDWSHAKGPVPDAASLCIPYTLVAPLPSTRMGWPVRPVWSMFVRLLLAGVDCGAVRVGRAPMVVHCAEVRVRVRVASGLAEVGCATSDSNRDRRRRAVLPRRLGGYHRAASA